MDFKSQQTTSSLSVYSSAASVLELKKSDLPRYVVAQLPEDQVQDLTACALNDTESLSQLHEHNSTN
eukprot:2001457-Amphidinium_carterae.1